MSKGIWQLKITNASLAVLAIVLTNASLFPSLTLGRSVDYVYMSAWALLGIVVLMRNRMAITRSTVLVIFLISVFIFLTGVKSFISGAYEATSLTYPVLSSLIMLVVGIEMFSQQSNVDKDIRLICYVYTVCILAAGLVIFFQFFFRRFSWEYVKYAYEYKNQYSQALLASMAFILFITPNEIIWKWIKVFVLSLLSFFLLMLRSRAVILEIPVIVIVYVSSLRSRKLLYFLLVVAVAVALFGSNRVSDVIINKTLLGNRYDLGLDAVASGRVEKITNSFKYLRSNIVWGVGYYYVDFLPLSALVQHGILTGTYIIALAFFPLWISIRFGRSNDLINKLLIALSVSYLINSMFEGVSPFGPGVKTYILWLLAGVVWSRGKKSVRLIR